MKITEKFENRKLRPITSGEWAMAMRKLAIKVREASGIGHFLTSLPRKKNAKKLSLMLAVFSFGSFLAYLAK